ncbi:MAG: hypothetical protein HY925_03260 [Elusimicrobia bacterium]|nr:hypothetical protein [Elusimicrobiota bacterium]
MHAPRAVLGLLAAALSSAAHAAPARVTVGAYLNDVQSLDLKTHSYAADVYLWFRWRDPKLNPAATAEFMNPNELWGHARTLSYDKPVRFADGELYQVMRVQGRFTSKMDLSSYPFDRQVIAVEFEDHRLDVSELEFVADAESVTRSPELRLPGYALGEPRLSVRSRSYPTSFGDKRAHAAEGYSRVRLEVPVSRPALTYSVKLLLPIACVIFCAALMVLFDPKHVDARVGIGITALLTIVALQITLNADLPDVDYLVLMDKVYLGAYLFVIVGLGLIVRTTRLADLGQGAKALRFERRALSSCLLVYLAAMFALLLSA